MRSWLSWYEHARPFSEAEAWLLFRIAAIAEACGWSLLIFGIVARRYLWPGNQTPVLLAGRVHGMLFLLYALASLLLYPSLRWPRIKALIAALASVPPFGSLLFEQWEAAHRQVRQRRILQRAWLYQYFAGD